MEWRSATWSAGWAWLEPVLAGATLLALLSSLARSVRIRFRRTRRSSAPAFVRRIVAFLGLGLALFASPSPASGRTSAHPGRSGRPLIEAPWRGTSGFPPPLPLVPSGSQKTESMTTESQTTHPAIHKGGPVRGAAPLFERADRRKTKERAESRRLHPVGNPRAVEVGWTPSVVVSDGDCLWAIAAEVLDSDDAQHVDAYWRAIFRTNRAVVGGDPNRVIPGQVLRLPRKTKS